MSIDSGIVPDDMKLARVTPIFKKSSPLDDYRPVSILIILISTILERSVYNQLSEYLDKNFYTNFSQALGQNSQQTHV